MDGIALVEQAREAGLELSFDGGRLCMKGPKRLSGLAQLITENKADVLAALSKPIASSFDNSSSGNGNESQKTQGHSEVSLPRRAEIRSHRSLVGRSFPRSARSPIPPESIRAAPVVVCPCCTSGPVLRELRHMAGGLCWTCW